MRETVDHRCLGAIEFVDALSGQRVREPLQLQAPGLRLRANGSALYVIQWAAGFDAHLEAFDIVPEEPAFESESFPVTVRDPRQRYLARLATIRLPRRDAPLADAGSVLRPVVVPLYPGAARAVDPLWAVLRVAVYTLVGGRRIGLANAWLTLTPTLPGVAPVRALSDANGEALLAVAGVAPVRPAAGAADDDPDVVFTRDFGATLRVVLHSAMVRRADATTPLPVADPDRIEDDLALGPPTVRIFNPPVAALSPGVLQRVDLAVLP